MNYIFDPEWFKSKQKFLLWFLNTPLIRVWFRRVMRIHKYDCKEKITQITPNSITWGDKLIWNTKKKRLEIERTTDFRTHNKYSKRLYHAFKYVWYLFHAWDLGFANNFAPQLNLGFDTLTVYPNADADVGKTSCDGYTGRTGVNETFSNIRSGAGTQAGDADANPYFLWLVGSATSNQFSALRRGIFLFDTSALTASASISDAVMSIYITNKDNGLSLTSAHAGIGIVSSNPASNTDLVNADFTTLGTTRFASDIARDSVNSAAYNAFTFNTDGKTAISKTGITKTGARFAVDIDNGTPAWASGGETQYYCYMSDQTGTTTDPKLVITYTTSTAYTATCSETLSLSDTISKSTKFNKSITETLSMTEGISKSQGMSKSLTETLSLSDAISSAIQRGLLLLETLHITDTLQRTTRFAKTLTESISLTDTLSIVKQFFVTLSETIGLTDAISKSTKFAKTISETLHLTDVIKVTGWFWNYLFKRTSSYDYKSKSKNTWTYKDK